MNDGKIEIQGKLDELIEANVNLTQFVMRSDKKNKASSEEEEVEDEEQEIAIEKENENEKEKETMDVKKSPSKTGEIVAMNKKMSSLDVSKEKKEKKEKKGELIKDEERGQGDVSMQTYLSYAYAAGGLFIASGYIVFSIFYKLYLMC